MYGKTNNLRTKQGWDLVGFLTHIRMKNIHYNSFLGMLWSLLNPALMFAAMYIVFNNQYGNRIPAYPLHLLTGIVCVNFFITSTSYLANIFYANRSLLLNTTIPHETVLVSGLCVHLYKFAVEISICILLAFAFRVASWSIFFILPSLILFVLMILAISIVISILTSFARDINYIWSITTRGMLFVTPVFYELSDLSGFAQKAVYFLNPLTPFVQIIRSALFGHFDFMSGAYVIFLTGAIGLFCFLFLRMTESIIIERI